MMKTLQQLNKKCPKDGHEDEPILMICLQKNCAQNLLCCCSCVDDDHVGHEIASLRKFENQVRQRLQKNNKNPQKIKISKLFQEYRLKFIQNLKILQNSIISRVHALQQQLNVLFSDIHHSLSIPVHSEIVQSLLKDTDVKNWSSIFRDMDICAKFNIGSAHNCKTILEYQSERFDYLTKNVRDQVNIQFDQLKKQIDLLNFNSKQIAQQPVFHPVYKYFDLSRLDNEAYIQRKKNNGNRTAALGNRPFDPINNTVKFNIIKNGDGIPSICVGAGILNVLKKNNFTNCTGNKRGVYCIDQASTTNWGSLQPSNEATYWNHDIQQANATIGFQFTEGDTIIVTVDFENGTIIFQVGEQIFDMDIDCTHRDLYPFVSLNNSNAIVQILQ